MRIGCKIDEVRIDGNLDALRRDLDHYAAIGLEAVELPVHGLDAIKNGAIDERRMSEILELLARYNFEYSVHSPNPLNLMDLHLPELHYSVFEATLVFAEQTNSKIVVYHSGRFVPEETFHLRKKQIMTESEKKSFLAAERQYLVELSKSHRGTIICLENARPYLYHSPYCFAERLEQLKKQIDMIARPNVRVNLDVGHLHMSSKYYEFDLLEAVRGIQPYVGHLHLHDNFGGTVRHFEKQQTHQIPFGRGDSHMPVGWGSIPIKDILTILTPEYKGMLMMELRSRYFDYLEESKDNLLSIVNQLTSNQNNENAKEADTTNVRSN